MANVPANAPKPVPKTGQVIVPDKLAAGRAAAEAERERIRKEAHEEGKHHGLRVAGRYRDVALIAIGFVLGAVGAGAFLLSVYDRGAVTAAAVVDQVLGRVTEPSLPPPLTVRDPADEYRTNAAAAREGCTVAQLRAGERNCGR